MGFWKAALWWETPALSEQWAYPYAIYTNVVSLFLGTSAGTAGKLIYFCAKNPMIVNTLDNLSTERLIKLLRQWVCCHR